MESSSQTTDGRASQASQAAILFFRYVAAIIVACITSIVVLLFLLIPVVRILGEVGILAAFVVVGFTGVLVGTICLPQRSWISGSIVLLLLGLGFAVFEISLTMTFGRSDGSTQAFLHILLLAAGGAGAVAVFFARRHKMKAAELDPISQKPAEYPRELSRTDQILLLIARYAAALIVTSITSSAIPFLLMMIPLGFGDTRIYLSYLSPIAISFAAICAGTFCLPPRRRPFGAIILLTLCFGYRIEFRGFPPSLPFIMGSVAAVVFFFIRERHRKAAEPSDTPTLSSNP